MVSPQLPALDIEIQPVHFTDPWAVVAPVVTRPISDTAGLCDLPFLPTATRLYEHHALRC
jgi:hypothetical protein